ncbi:MAG TPA: fused MFS/spermidine synthase [Terriglobales bacterium]|nr:fused MFS/spermidine synthase [Terriglobales bacterium]
MSAAATPSSNVSLRARAHPVVSRLAYGFTIFSSAFLLFQVQPIITKLILPWFGGAAAVWSVCLLFFQTFLLIGYLYAHLLTKKLQPRAQGWVHAALLAASLLVLPIVPRATLQPDGTEDPALRVLLVLALTIGLPYFLLASTSPLLQAWVASSASARDPYRLYALSNAGSLLGLLTYPVFFEPRLSNRHQAICWSVAYAGVAALLATLTFANHASGEISLPMDSAPTPAVEVRAWWVALAACGSMLLLSITNHISQNIAAIPLLWIIPLSLYLLTFIVCFADRSFYRQGLFLQLLAVTLAGMAFALAPGHGNLPPTILVPLFCTGLFACCMVCHGELARLKPDPSHLTSFYLLISLGGTVGALFVALLAPHIFTGYYELPVALGFCGVLIPIVLYRDTDFAAHTRFRKQIFLAAAVLITAFCASLYVSAQRSGARARVSVRNFYGALRVEDRVATSVALTQGDKPQPLDADPRYRDLINGTIEHGIQFLSGGRRLEATTYYARNSGVGLAIKSVAQQGPVKVGVIGLGAGTIAAYGRPGDDYTFYEINPLVIEVANNEFSFLRQSRAQVNVVLGDARLSLEKGPSQQFDVLAVDAFSSDAIPIHLLTREAFQLYARQTKSTGLIAVHVSNKYLDLEPVVAAAATTLGRRAVLIDSPPDEAQEIYRASWILVGSDSVLNRPEFPSWWSVKGTSKDLWTDDYSSVLQTFK